MAARIEEALSQAPRDLLQFEFEGLRFGALSVMDLVLALKISDFSELAERRSPRVAAVFAELPVELLLVDRPVANWASPGSCIATTIRCCSEHGRRPASTAFPVTDWPFRVIATSICGDI